MVIITIKNKYTKVILQSVPKSVPKSFLSKNFEKKNQKSELENNLKSLFLKKRFWNRILEPQKKILNLQ